MQCVLILHDIRSIHNVGSIFRTADAAGVSELILTGYTPTPFDRFGRTRNDLAKVALGAEKSVPWEHAPEAAPRIETLKRDGFRIFALEQDPHSIPLSKFPMPKEKEKIALILGNEVDGIPSDLLALAEYILEIPMLGSKESLNVAVAAGIALYAITMQPARLPS